LPEEPEIKICPRCHGEYSHRNTKSRRLRTIPICPKCLDEEALIDWYQKEERASEIPGEIMERETEFLNKISRGELKY